MSKLLINQYLAQLDVLKKVGGTHREPVVREAFKDLLTCWGKEHEMLEQLASVGDRRVATSSATRFASPFLYDSELFVDEGGSKGAMFPVGRSNNAICFSDAGSRTAYVNQPAALSSDVVKALSSALSSYIRSKSPL